MDRLSNKREWTRHYKNCDYLREPQYVQVITFYICRDRPLINCIIYLW